MRLLRPLAVLLLLALLAACGNSRTPVPSLTQPAAPNGFRALIFPRAGIRLEVPRNWAAIGERAPLLAIVSSGAAIVAVWRYRRTGSPPPDLGRVRRGLITAARARDNTLRVVSSTVTTVSGSPAIVLDAIESIAGQPRRVRSLHVFRRAAELVIDEYAPPAVFGAVDRQVFSPLARSLQLSA